MSASTHRDGFGKLAAQFDENFIRLFKHLRKIQSARGMTPERLRALSAIVRHAPVAVTTLADMERVRPATMSRMVSGLVDDGLVNRRPDALDGRGVLLTVTRKGRRQYQSALRQSVRAFGAALAALTPDELATVLDAAGPLETFIAALEGRDSGG